MSKTIVSRIAALVCVGVFAVAMLAGCVQQTSTVSEEQEANRQYMSQVNQKMDDLSSKLERFNDAVSRGDVVAMRTQADAAFKVIDEMAAIEAPEILSDIKSGYVEGCTKLEDALSAYVALYTDLSSSGSVDSSAYQEALASIQTQYDEGIAKLEETDAKASALKNDEADSSQQQ